MYRRSKFYIALLIFCILGMLTGCNITNNGSDTTQTSDQTETTEELPEYTPSPTLPSMKDGTIAEFPEYRIDCINGHFYFNFADGNDYVPPEISMSMQSWISFPSYRDMIYRTFNGLLEPEECNAIKRVFPKDENGIKLPNLYLLYAPIVQKGWENTSMHLSDSFYGFKYEGKLSAPLSGLITFSYFSSESAFQHALDSAKITIKAVTDDKNITILKHTDEDGIVTLEYISNESQYRFVYREMEWGEKKYHILEYYIIEDHWGEKRESDVLPALTDIYISENGCYYMFDLDYFSRVLSPKDIVELTQITILSPLLN